VGEVTDFLRTHPLVIITLFLLAVLTVGFLVSALADHLEDEQ